jgi:Rhomboid family
MPAPERRPVPVLTLAVAAATVLVSVAGLLSPGLRADLQRLPGELAAGEPWRLVASLLVHDDVVALAGNMVLLVVIGATAEARFRRAWWVALFLAGGLTGELAGLRWEPTGAGDSVAVFGLLGGLATASLLSGVRDACHERGETPERTTGRAGLALGLAWVVALIAGDLPGVAGTVVFAGLAAAASLGVRAHHAGRLPAGTDRALAAAVGAGAVVLLVLTDIHGAALAAGMVAGLAAARGGQQGQRALAPPSAA